MSETRPSAPRVLVRAAERGPDFSGGHPYNPRAEVHGWPVSRRAGLQRIAVNLGWLPPGKESAEYHVHYREEEWLHVLSGRGVAEVDGAEHEVGPGDFLGFPAGGPAHHLRNPSGEDLVYLQGGDASGGVEVVDFPRVGKRRVRLDAERAYTYPMGSGRS